jgi:hypothetical protein
MKYPLLALSAMLLTTQLHAQKIEVSAHADASLYHFAGNGAVSSTFINDAGISDSYFNNPYGNKNGFGYGGSIQGQFVSKGGFIIGVQGGYEFLKSEADITSVYPPPSPDAYYTFASTMPAARGTAYLQQQNINLNPYLGYRLLFKVITLDLMPGIDFGFNLNSTEKGSATTASPETYTVDRKLQDFPTDVRLRMALAVWYKKFGLTFSYAHGLKNFEPDLNQPYGYTGVAQEAHSELLRFGVCYRIF